METSKTTIVGKMAYEPEVKTIPFKGKDLIV
jgi:hypothetical protein